MALPLRNRRGALLPHRASSAATRSVAVGPMPSPLEVGAARQSPSEKSCFSVRFKKPDAPTGGVSWEETLLLLRFRRPRRSRGWMSSRRRRLLRPRPTLPIQPFDLNRASLLRRASGGGVVVTTSNLASSVRVRVRPSHIQGCAKSWCQVCEKSSARLLSPRPAMPGRCLTKQSFF